MFVEKPNHLGKISMVERIGQLSLQGIVFFFSLICPHAAVQRMIAYRTPK